MPIVSLTQRHPIEVELAALVEATAGMDRGDRITPDRIEEITGLKRGSPPFDKCKRKWQQAVFRDRGIKVKWDGEAYLFPPADQQVVLAHNEQVKNRRNELRAKLTAGVVPKESLSKPMQTLQAQIVSSAQTNADAMKAQQRERKPLLLEYEPLPRFMSKADAENDD